MSRVRSLSSLTFIPTPAVVKQLLTVRCCTVSTIATAYASLTACDCVHTSKRHATLRERHAAWNRCHTGVTVGSVDSALVWLSDFRKTRDRILDFWSVLVQLSLRDIGQPQVGVFTYPGNLKTFRSLSFGHLYLKNVLTRPDAMWISYTYVVRPVWGLVLTSCTDSQSTAGLLIAAHKKTSPACELSYNR